MHITPVNRAQLEVVVYEIDALSEQVLTLGSPIQELIVNKVCALLQTEQNFSIDTLHTLLKATISCLGSSTQTSTLVMHIICMFCEQLNNNMEEDLVLILAEKCIKYLDSPSNEERFIVIAILQSIYTNNPRFRTHMRMMMGNALLQPLNGMTLHRGSSELLDIFYLIIQGFAMPVKETHISFCRFYLIPMLSFLNLESFFASLRRCLLQFAMMSTTLHREITMYALQTCSDPAQLSPNLLLNLGMDLLPLLSDSDYRAIQVLFYQRLALFLQSAKVECVIAGLKPFEDVVLGSLLLNHLSVCQVYLIPALQKSLVMHSDQLGEKCGRALQLLSGRR